MERGTIRSYDQDSGNGTIGRSESVDVRFSANSIIGSFRSDLKLGDLGWFEIENILSNHVAVNIRKCV